MDSGADHASTKRGRFGGWGVEDASWRWVDRTRSDGAPTETPTLTVEGGGLGLNPKVEVMVTTATVLMRISQLCLFHHRQQIGEVPGARTGLAHACCYLLNDTYLLTPLRVSSTGRRVTYRIMISKPLLVFSSRKSWTQSMALVLREISKSRRTWVELAS